MLGFREDKVYSVEKVSNLLSMEILLEPKNITLRVNGPVFLWRIQVQEKELFSHVLNLHLRYIPYKYFGCVPVHRTNENLLCIISTDSGASWQLMLLRRKYTRITWNSIQVRLKLSKPSLETSFPHISTKRRHRKIHSALVLCKRLWQKQQTRGK